MQGSQPDQSQPLWQRPLAWGLLVVLLVLEFFLVYHTPRPDFTQLILLYGGMFVLHLGVLKWAMPERDYGVVLVSGVVLRAVLIFAVPELSDDFYRFLWDAQMADWGYNPFQVVPEELWSELSVMQREKMGLVYEKMNSRGYFTVYPPLLQGVFRFAYALAPDSIPLQVALMKSSIVLAEIGTIWVLHKLSQTWKLGRKMVWVYALNPLAIVELSGGLHFEAFMIFFVLLGVFLLTRKKWFFASPVFALAVGAKLLPLMFFPFLVRRLGLKKSLGFFTLTGIFIGLLFIPLADPVALKGFFTSVQLYFKTFEFNASIYYFLKWVLPDDQHFLYSKILSVLVFGIIVWRALNEEPEGVEAAKRFSRAWWSQRKIPLPVDAKLLEGFVIAFFTYFACATTVHPWYLASLVAFAALTRFRFPVLWTFLILFTYITYQSTDYAQSYLVIWVEYLAVFGFFAYEWWFKRDAQTLEDRIHDIPFLKKLIAKSIPGRVQIKIGHIAPHLSKEDRILDIGTGNGGLCHTLLGMGMNVQPLDVKDISFFPEVNPIVYDGSALPFKSGEFDVAMLITMLHHTPDPEAILKEALRVAPKLVVMEDIFNNPIQKHLTFFTDSLVNFEFEGHPHTNRTDEEWKATFERLGLRLISVEYRRTLVFFRQVVYVVERK